MNLKQTLYDTIEATWPAAEVAAVGNWTIRNGAGGGQRISACSVNGPVSAADISQAEEAMLALNQGLLFMVREDDKELDRMLAERSYRKHDPVVMYHCPVETLTQIAPERLAAFAIWPPLAIINQIWTEQGIGTARQAVMARAKGPKTAILARQNDRAAGVAYVAIHGTTAMLHALEVVPEQRRQGVAVNIMGVAAIWAQDNGATDFSVICVRDNLPANRLYTSLNMENVGCYHYRIKDQK